MYIYYLIQRSTKNFEKNYKFHLFFSKTSLYKKRLVFAKITKFCYFNKSMRKKVKTNIILFVVAIPIAMWLFFLLESPNFLWASVISLREQEAMKENKWDLWYTNEWNVLDVFLDDKVENLDYLTVSIAYDQENVSFDLDDIDAQTEYKILSNDDWNLLIQFNNFSNKNFDYKNSLFMLKFSWETQNILVSQATASLFTWNDRFLAVWSLNQYRQAHD